jgi:uncharacterized protein YycO
VWLAKIIRVPALVFDLPMCSFSRKISSDERRKVLSVLETGDILLTTDKLFPAWELVSICLGSPQYSHAAIYEGENRVIEATTFHPSGYGVAHTEVQEYFSGRKNVCVLRPAYRSNEDKSAMLDWLQQQIGKPYDYGFNFNNDRAMYCSKLVAKAMGVADITVSTIWKFRREGYIPDTFLQMADVRIMYRKPETIADKLMDFLPLAIVVSLWIANLVPLWAALLGWLGVGALQFKLKI